MHTPANIFSDANRRPYYLSVDAENRVRDDIERVVPSTRRYFQPVDNEQERMGQLARDFDPFGGQLSPCNRFSTDAVMGLRQQGSGDSREQDVQLVDSLCPPEEALMIDETLLQKLILLKNVLSPDRWAVIDETLISPWISSANTLQVERVGSPCLEDVEEEEERKKKFKEEMKEGEEKKKKEEEDVPPKISGPPAPTSTGDMPLFGPPKAPLQQDTGVLGEIYRADGWTLKLAELYNLPQRPGEITTADSGPAAVASPVQPYHIVREDSGGEGAAPVQQP